MSTSLIVFLVASTFVTATPLLLAALGELIGERAGVLNIGLEGMMLVGAWAGAAFSFLTVNGGLGLLAAMLAGAALAAVFAFLVINLGTDAIVIGTGINLFAFGLTGTLNRGFDGRFAAICANQPQLASCTDGHYHAVVLPHGLFTCAALLLAPALWWGLRSTRAGLRLRASGEYPAAAETAGVNVTRTRWLCTLCNGALCGAAGAFLSMSQLDGFGENMTEGRGFIALTIVIFGRWSPLGAVAAALVFGAAEVAQNYWQPALNHAAGAAIYPLLLCLPYVLTIATLAGFRGSARAPAALGVMEERN